MVLVATIVKGILAWRLCEGEIFAGASIYALLVAVRVVLTPTHVVAAPTRPRPSCSMRTCDNHGPRLAHHGAPPAVFAQQEVTAQDLHHGIPWRLWHASREA